MLESIYARQISAVRIRTSPSLKIGKNLPMEITRHVCTSLDVGLLQIHNNPGLAWQSLGRNDCAHHGYCYDMRPVQARNQAAPSELIPALSIRGTKLIFNQQDLLVVYRALVIPSSSIKIFIPLNYNGLNSGW